MGLLVRARDIKVLIAGVAVAIVAGLLAGRAMHPNLGEAPQAPIAARPLRTLEAADPGISVYRGRVPEYVTGTDANRPLQLDFPEWAEEPEPHSEAAAVAEDPAATQGPLGGDEDAPGLVIDEGARRDVGAPDGAG